MDYITDEKLTVNDVADILYIGKNTVYSLLQSREIKAFRIGKSWRIPREALNRFIINKAKMEIF